MFSEHFMLTYFYSLHTSLYDIDIFFAILWYVVIKLAIFLFMCL